MLSLFVTGVCNWTSICWVMTKLLLALTFWSRFLHDRWIHCTGWRFLGISLVQCFVWHDRDLDNVVGTPQIHISAHSIPLRFFWSEDSNDKPKYFLTKAATNMNMHSASRLDHNIENASRNGSQLPLLLFNVVETATQMGVRSVQNTIRMDSKCLGTVNHLSTILLVRGFRCGHPSIGIRCIHPCAMLLGGNGVYHFHCWDTHCCRHVGARAPSCHPNWDLFGRQSSFQHGRLDGCKCREIPRMGMH